jgi:type II secretory pathway component GspD/PulD (secretin)
MKMIFNRGAIFVFAFFLFLPQLNANPQAVLPEPQPNISMDFQDANLKDILKVLSIQSGLNFIASEAVQDRKVTLYLDNVPLSVTMDRIFKANNLTYELDRDEHIFLVKDWGKPEVETITKVFYLKYATVSSSSLKEEMSRQLKKTSTISIGEGGGGEGGGESSGGSGKWKQESEVGLTQAIKKLLSDKGTVIEDFRTNSLIVTDTPKRMEQIAGVVAALDVPAPQVLLEVEMLDVSKNVVDTIGIKYGQSPMSVVITAAKAATKFPFGPDIYGTKAVTGGNTFTAGSVDFSQSPYQVIMDFLRTNTDTKYLARPRVLTLNNEPAEIKIATDESIGVKETTTAAGGAVGSITAEAERQETGVILRITPQINIDTGEITMFVYPKVADSTSGNPITSGSRTYTFRDPEERSSKSVVRLMDGDTVIIGGLIRKEKTEIITKLPILGDLPVVGSLFRHKNKSKDKERELLIFITPHIIKNAADTTRLAQNKKLTLPEREQSAPSFPNRDLAVSSSLDTFDKKKK